MNDYYIRLIFKCSRCGVGEHEDIKDVHKGSGVLLDGVALQPYDLLPIKDVRPQRAYMSKIPMTRWHDCEAWQAPQAISQSKGVAYFVGYDVAEERKALEDKS